MTIDALIMCMGALTVLLPYLGIPSAWDMPLYTFFGIVIIACGITVRRTRRMTPRNTEGFVDSRPAEHSPQGELHE